MGSARPDDDVARRTPRARHTLLAGGLGVVIVLAAAFGGTLSFGGPRWILGGLPRATATAVPSPVQTITASPPSGDSSRSGPDLTWLVVVLASVVGAAIVFFVVRAIVLRLRNRATGAKGELREVVPEVIGPADPTVETSMPFLRRGLRRALDELDGRRAPTDAIIAAWLGLQEAAEDAGFERGSAETPTEFTTRILRSVEVDERSLTTLRRLYLAVRFGDRVATDADVADARAALRTLDAQWDAQPQSGGASS